MLVLYYFALHCKNVTLGYIFLSSMEETEKQNPTRIAAQKTCMKGTEQTGCCRFVLYRPIFFRLNLLLSDEENVMFLCKQQCTEYKKGKRVVFKSRNIICDY